MTTESSLSRTQDTGGTVKQVKTYEDTDGSHIQAVGIADSDGDQITSTNPLPTQIGDGSSVKEGTLNVTVDDLFTTMNDILKELQKISFQMAVLTDVPLQSSDVGE